MHAMIRDAYCLVSQAFHPLVTVIVRQHQIYFNRRRHLHLSFHFYHSFVWRNEASSPRSLYHLSPLSPKDKPSIRHSFRSLSSAWMHVCFKNVGIVASLRQTQLILLLFALVSSNELTWGMDPWSLVLVKLSFLSWLELWIRTSRLSNRLLKIYALLLRLLRTRYTVGHLHFQWKDVQLVSSWCCFL